MPTATTTQVAALVAPSPIPPTPFPPTTSPTVEPSPTVDPNMPEGATGKNANGEWVDQKGGVWNPEVQTFERHLNLNDQGVTLINFNQQQHDLGGMRDHLPLFVNISDKVQGFDKLDSISTHPGAGDKDLSFANVIRGFFSDSLRMNTWREDKAVSIATIEGKGTWIISKDDSHKIVVDILDKAIGDGFQTWTDSYGTTFQSRIFTKDGDLHVWIVPGKPVDQLKKVQLMEMYLFGPASIFNNTDQTKQGSSTPLDTLSVAAINPQLLPLFDFVPSQ